VGLISYASHPKPPLLIPKHHFRTSNESLSLDSRIIPLIQLLMQLEREREREIEREREKKRAFKTLLRALKAIKRILWQKP